MDSFPILVSSNNFGSGIDSDPKSRRNGIDSTGIEYNIKNTQWVELFLGKNERMKDNGKGGFLLNIFFNNSLSLFKIFMYCNFSCKIYSLIKLYV